MATDERDHQMFEGQFCNDLLRAHQIHQMSRDAESKCIKELLFTFASWSSFVKATLVWIRPNAATSSWSLADIGPLWTSETIQYISIINPLMMVYFIQLYITHRRYNLQSVSDGCDSASYKRQYTSTQHSSKSYSAPVNHAPKKPRWEETPCISVGTPCPSREIRAIRKLVLLSESDTPLHLITITYPKILKIFPSFSALQHSQTGANQSICEPLVRVAD